jgi:alkylation response protein AidB-like acyl-CoA dehydrogenase
MPTANRLTYPPEAIARAAALAPKLAARAQESESLRRLPDATVSDFLESELYKVLLPAGRGGWALGWDTHVACAIELGKGDASQAWVLTSYGDQVQAVSAFSREAQDEVWAHDAPSLTAAASAPSGTLVSAGGDYIASGTWRGAAGVDHANWLLAGAYVIEGEARRLLYFLVPKSAATLIDDWHVTGLSGTGSKSFTLQEVSIPAHRVLDENSLRDGASLALAAVPLGTAAAMLDEFVTIACDTVKRGRRVENNYATSLRIAESKAEIDAASLACVTAARETMQVLADGSAPTPERRALNLLKSAHAVLTAARAADRLFAGGGAKANMLSNRLQRYLLDIHAAAAQDAFAWDQTASTYGQLRLSPK